MLSVVAQTGRSASPDAVPTQTLRIETRSVQYLFDYYKNRENWRTSQKNSLSLCVSMLMVK
jgi:hypothetical protein